MCVVAALAIFTSPVDAESERREIFVQDNFWVGCNINQFVFMNGHILLDTTFTLASNRLYVDALVRPRVQVFTERDGYFVSGTTQVSQYIVRFLNGEANLDIPCSFRATRGTARFEIQYTTHLTFRQIGVVPSLAGVDYDNFRVVCL